MTTRVTILTAGTRLKVQQAEVLTTNTTASAGYVPLDGPALTMTTTGLVIVTISGQVENLTANDAALMSFGVSGATAIGPTDDRSLVVTGASANPVSSSIPFLLTVNPGVNTFTVYYRASLGTLQALRRRIMVESIG